MSQAVDFAGVGGAIVFSIALGVYVEWLAMRGLMRLMPATSRVTDIRKSAPVSGGVLPQNNRQGTKAA